MSDDKKFYSFGPMGDEEFIKRFYGRDDETFVHRPSMDEWLKTLRGTMRVNPRDGGFTINFDDPPDWEPEWTSEARRKAREEINEAARAAREESDRQRRAREAWGERYTYEGRARPKATPTPAGGLRRSKEQNEQRETAIRLVGKALPLVQSEFAGQAAAALNAAAKTYLKYYDALTRADRLDLLNQIGQAVDAFYKLHGNPPADLMPVFEQLRA